MITITTTIIMMNHFFFSFSNLVLATASITKLFMMKTLLTAFLDN